MLGRMSEELHKATDTEALWSVSDSDMKTCKSERGRLSVFEVIQHVGNVTTQGARLTRHHNRLVIIFLVLFISSVLNKAY